MVERGNSLACAAGLYEIAQRWGLRLVRAFTLLAPLKPRPAIASLVVPIRTSEIPKAANRLRCR